MTQEEVNSLLQKAQSFPFPTLEQANVRIEQLQLELTTSQARVKELEQTVDALSSSNCNLNDTLRSRGYGHAAGKNTEERFITFVHAFDRAQQRIATLEQALRETTKVGVCVVIRNEFDQVLLGLKGRACSSEFLNKWVIPGGRLNYKEGIESGIRREIREETGIEIRISRFLPPQEVIHESGHFVFVICEAWHLSGQCVGNDDLTQVKWFDRDRLPVDMTPITRAALATISAVLNEKEGK